MDPPHTPTDAYKGFTKAWHVCAQSCASLCDPTDCSPPGSSVLGIFQARNAGVGCHFLLTQGSMSLESPTLADSLPPVPPGNIFGHRKKNLNRVPLGNLKASC